MGAMVVSQSALSVAETVLPRANPATARIAIAAMRRLCLRDIPPSAALTACPAALPDAHHTRRSFNSTSISADSRIVVRHGDGSHRPCRVADHDRPRRYIAGDHATGADDCSLADGDPAQNSGTGADRGALLDDRPLEIPVRLGLQPAGGRGARVAVI